MIINADKPLLSFKVQERPDDLYSIQMILENHSGVPGDEVFFEHFYKSDLILIRDYLIEMQLGKKAEI